MLPTEVPQSHPGPSVLLLLQLLLPPTSAFFPNIWSLLAAPGSITHQDLTDEAALNVTLQLFLERPPPGRPPLRLEDFLVSIPGSCHTPARVPNSWGLYSVRALVAKRRDTHGPIPAATIPSSLGPEIRSPPPLWGSGPSYPALSVSC